MRPFGNFKKRILNVGEAPGETEDNKGRQWQGKVGKALKKAFEKFGVDLFEDCININAINCRPTDEDGNNRKPTTQEIACCRNKILRVIDEYKPKLIILFGDSAVNSLIGHRWKKDLGTISKWRGWTIPDRDFGCWVCPCYHPSYMERGDNEVETIWMQDLENVLAMVDVPFPDFPDERKQVVILDDPDELERVLAELAAGSFPPDPNLLAVDIETTGLKPHSDGHRIVSWAFSDNPNRAYSFLHPRNRRYQRLIRKLLESNVGKAAQNMKFEQAWIKCLMKTDVNNWTWDTMLAAHMLDNRPGITGLKFQTYINFGVVNYDSETEPYLKGSDSKSANSKNKIEKLLETRQGTERLLLYGGMDALFTYKLALKQNLEIVQQKKYEY
jgi:uracil-DNA glycosylase family 4